MTTEAKLLASTALLPVLADFLEDCELNRKTKAEATKVINFIRGLDKLLMDEATIEEYNQQVDIQRAFRQWLEVSFKEEEDEI